MDTKETKENIRKAALHAKRWGVAGRHTVFLRDTLPEKTAQKRGRSSSNEVTKTPKKRRTDDEETPRSSRSKKDKSHLRSRLDGWPEDTQAKVTSEKEELEKIRLERLEARGPSTNTKKGKTGKPRNSSTNRANDKKSQKGLPPRQPSKHSKL